MKKLAVACIMILLLFGNISFRAKVLSSNNTSSDTNTIKYYYTIKRDLLCLMMAYPEYITNIEKEESGQVYLVMKSGRKILYDDKKSKNFEKKLSDPDLQDMMEQEYPLSYSKSLMEEDFDPGRRRVYALLKEVYGESKQQVESNLKNVSLGYGNYQFNNNNKAAESLQNAMKEIIPITEKRKDIKVCVYPCSGTFNYRLIAGTNQLSPHSFGIAIDLARDKRDYWKWGSREEGEKRIASYPKELVEIFEKNNFIWGGKWGHFDILHFEYRPEIILKARYFGDKLNDKEWYIGAPYEDLSVKNYIEKINQVFK
ncbi:M15 family metallopeptidase [Clostridium sp. OS1-26]|uniref:M15 family metallopeptidase n=1 Tax=Clostridium sp. OS1-26 TaxID=3070681 RepID=UPI0027E1F537|nr:M15 family metallopeptidase [Clostridium sp. OS1-26]WML34859.1 M15 family metallopeptidase [Clostridium sp. OS1-26]